METENIKQIIVAYYAIETACDAMLKPIRIELGDAETVAKMTRANRYTLELFSGACEGIQEVLREELYEHIDRLEKEVDADEELAEAGDMIRDILFDIKPPSNTLENTNLVEFAGNLVGDIRKAQIKAGEDLEKALFGVIK